MKEEWKDIKGYEGLYQVSNLGRVKRLPYTRINLLTPQGVSKIPEHIITSIINKSGYNTVMLYKNTARKWIFVHRLVAEAFIPNPDNLPYINHKDENKLNNKVDNLEWCTSKYNSNYGTRNKRISNTKRNNTYNTKPVICIETGIIYPSTREAERQTGIINTHISACCNKKPHYKTAGGFHWKYAE